MTDSEKLDLILSEIQGTNKRIESLEDRMTCLEEQNKVIEQRITGLELHIENGTDKNIQLLAENFVELTKKLNQAIPVADNNLAYEVKVNYLVDEMEKMKKEIAELKGKIA